MLPKDVLRDVRRIQITTSRLVTDIFAGQYQSVFKGRGMEFDEVREYQQGDEVRAIDWNVTARMGHPYIKKFVEEREMTVMLLLDMSASSLFGTTQQLKIHVAAHLCSVLALSATRNNDRVGFIGFTDRIEKSIPARKGMRHVLRIVREALYTEPQGRGTDINGVLEYLYKTTTRRSVAFVISDFFAPDFKKTLTVVNKRHDVVAVAIADPRESVLVDAGLCQLADAETGQSYQIDTSDARVRARYNELALTRLKQRATMFASAGVDMIEVSTDVPYTKSLREFFRRRERRMR